MWAATLLAAAVLALPRAGAARLRADLGSARRAGRRTATEDPLALAATLDVFAACLRAGMAASRAATAATDSAPAPLGTVLRRAANLLALGADASQAWADPDGPVDQHVHAFLRMARRSAASGAALAHGVEDLGVQLRADAADAAAARAERAAVLIAGPLGLCFLPAFLCLGIVPVVSGLAGEVLRSGVL